ncbi:helix-turn-helix domain-containing protein [Puteibacter caeruleilacunae]|nr:helix-turn-helix domain-containing protein [Puteibacter caeruleilacunae]
MIRDISSDDVFSQRLAQFVVENISDEQLSVADLEDYMGMNRSTIHRKLKQQTNKSVTQFIREIRLERAKELLENNGESLREIGEQVGFSSSSYFHKCFHDYFGFTPGDYRKKLFEELAGGEIVNQAQLKNISTQSYLPAPENGINKKKVISILKEYSSLAIFVIVSFILINIVWNKYALYEIFDRKVRIIVLPFEIQSEDTDNQYFAFGLVDDIRRNLSEINDFEVISRTTSEYYSSNKATSSAIAKALKVDYILEGSVIQVGDLAKVSIELQDAPKDKSIWIDTYEKELVNIFTVQNEVAKDITSALNIVLSDDEAQRITTPSSMSPEANMLYYQARSYWHDRKAESMRHCIELYHKALEYDPEFSLIYEGLADAHMINGWFEWVDKDESYMKSRKYAQKALSIDNHLSQPHATIGTILCYHELKWDEAQKELERAVKLNPNNADALQYYSEYWNIVGDHRLARLYINKALELNPYSLMMLWLSSYYYFAEGEIERTIEECDKILKIEESEAHRFTFLKFWSNVHLGYEQKAYELLLRHAKQMKFSEDEINTLKAAYNSRNIAGVVEWMLINSFKRDPVSYYGIASCYVYLGDYENALKYLYMSYNVRESCVSRFNTDYNLRQLWGHPEGIALLKKMGLRE